MSVSLIGQRPIPNIPQIDVKRTVPHLSAREQRMLLVINLTTIAHVTDNLEIESVKSLIAQAEVNCNCRSNISAIFAKYSGPHKQSLSQLVLFVLSNNLAMSKLKSPFVIVVPTKFNNSLVWRSSPIGNRCNIRLSILRSHFPLIQEPPQSTSIPPRHRLSRVSINFSRLRILTKECSPLYRRHMLNSVILRHILIRSSLIIPQRLLQRSSRQLKRRLENLRIIRNLKRKHNATSQTPRTFCIRRTNEHHLLAIRCGSSIQHSSPRSYRCHLHIICTR